MRDKRRLELLENGSSFSSDDITFLLRQARLYQISRDDTRKACHKVREENKKLEQQNKRYREALEYLLSEVNEMDEPHEALTDFLVQALEEGMTIN